jgi:hypothetical protein
MPFQYDNAVPWGRNFDEYRRMFALTDDELTTRIASCGDGPAAFNAEMARAGRPMVSCDPLYQLTANQIQSRIDATYTDVIEQTRHNQAQFQWSDIKSIDELAKIRMSAMQTFLADFGPGKREGRYVAAELPDLPFGEASFDIAICSHFLFLYYDNLSLEFHIQAVKEMCRVARQSRIFPLLTYNAEPSPYVDPLLDSLSKSGYKVSIETVRYEFQREGNKMLRVMR